MFFNQDKVTLTFVGFMVINGDAVDPATLTIIEPKVMSKRLQRRLVEQNINLSEDYRKWSRCVKIPCVTMHAHYMNLMLLS